MAKSDISRPARKLLLNDLLIALSLLTRLPGLRADWTDATRPSAKAAWAYPVAGAIAVAPALGLGFAGQALQIAPPITALMMLAATILATGAMHEDGLADCADGFWGGWEPARRLEIMKDSAIGTYGVLALLCVLGLKWAALAHWLALGGSPVIVIAVAMLSRSAMGCVMQALPSARMEGLSAQTGKPGWTTVLIGAATSSLAALIAFGFGGFLATVLVTIGAAALVAGIAQRKIKGQTGDVLGATQNITELALFVLIATAMTTR